MTNECIHYAEMDELNEELLKIGEEEKKREEERLKQIEKNTFPIVSEDHASDIVSKKLIMKLQLAGISREKIEKVILASQISHLH
jgi:hypothetical protein